MKKKDWQQLKETDLEGLKQLLSKAELDAVKVKIEGYRSQTKDVHQYLKKRKEIAKIKTLIKEKESLKK